MRRKKDLFRNELFELMSMNEMFIVNNNQNESIFEMGNEVTTDVAEAVSILMRNHEKDNSIWKTKIEDIKIEDITPERCLFWLSGGDREWEILENYNKPWCECYLDFQEEFGFMVIKIVKRSKTLGDIRDGFIRYLNLPTLYEFALSKNLIR